MPQVAKIKWAKPFEEKVQLQLNASHKQIDIKSLQALHQMFNVNL